MISPTTKKAPEKHVPQHTTREGGHNPRRENMLLRIPHPRGGTLKHQRSNTIERRIIGLTRDRTTTWKAWDGPHKEQPNARGTQKEPKRGKCTAAKLGGANKTITTNNNDGEATVSRLDNKRGHATIPEGTRQLNAEATQGSHSHK